MIKDIIQKKIKNVDIVSFDLYDTLIYRLVQNHNIFDIVQSKYNQESKDMIKDFKDIRINSEKSARKQTKNEIKFDDIYNNIKDCYKGKYDLELLKKLELEIEENFVTINKKMYDIYKMCKSDGKKIIITSDMYLDKCFIERILNKMRIEYDDLFVSSDLGFKKSNFKMYKHIIKKYNIKPSKIIHIGDNKKSDFLIPKILGIKSILVKNKTLKRLDYKKDFLYRYTNYNINNDKDDYFQIGYKALGPFVYGFCSFLNRKLSGDSKVLFLSREGQFLKRAYDVVSNRDSDYIYVSRKSISSYLIKSPNVTDKKSLIDMQSLTQTETIESFLNRFTLLNKKNQIILKKNNIDTHWKYSDYKDVINSIFPNLVKNSEVKYDNFIQYIKQKGINSNTVFVDVGWTGTMQDLIQLELDSSQIKVNGLYMGVRNKRKNNQKIGYLFDGEKNNRFETISRSMVGLIEIILSANHGTTIGYEKEGNMINPVIAPNDVNEEVLSYVIKIQEGALHFIEEFKKSKLDSYIDLSSEDYFNELLLIGINPNSKEIKLFKEFQTYDENIVKLVGNKNLFYYFFHLNDFKEDFLSSTWKNAFLKNIFRLPVNYYKLFEILYYKEQRR